MGLLDDAIREHLELQRLRGADPGAVARQEHDALGPVLRREEAAQDEYDGAPEDVSIDMDEAPSAGSEPTRGGDVSTASQETAELDMETVLDSERAAATSPASIPGDLAAERHSGEDPVEESLEWEVPEKRSDALHKHADGHDAGGQTGDSEEPAEDALEETPDFARDTPEQEHLWFEQRPPRDVGLNE